MTAADRTRVLLARSLDYLFSAHFALSRRPASAATIAVLFPHIKAALRHG